MRSECVLAVLLTLVASPALAGPPGPDGASPPADRGAPDPGAFRRRRALRPPRDVPRPSARPRDGAGRPQDGYRVDPRDRATTTSGAREGRPDRSRREGRRHLRRHAHVRRRDRSRWDGSWGGWGWYGGGSPAWSQGGGWPTWAWPFDPFGYPSDYGYLPGTGWSSGVIVGGYDGGPWEPDPDSVNPLDRVPTVLDPAIADAAPLDACQLYDADDGWLVGDPVPCAEVRDELSPGLWVVTRTNAAPGEVHGRYLDDAGRPMELVFDADTGRLLEQIPG